MDLFLTVFLLYFGNLIVNKWFASFFLHPKWGLLRSILFLILLGGISGIFIKFFPAQYTVTHGLFPLVLPFIIRSSIKMNTKQLGRKIMIYVGLIILLLSMIFLIGQTVYSIITPGYFSSLSQNDQVGFTWLWILIISFGLILLTVKLSLKITEHKGWERNKLFVGLLFFLGFIVLALIGIFLVSLVILSSITI